jgi:hypothetical protein
MFRLAEQPEEGSMRLCTTRYGHSVVIAESLENVLDPVVVLRQEERTSGPIVYAGIRIDRL